jgi:ABC-type glycerol-3-phosphate transport system substrate-binding protein
LALALAGVGVSNAQGGLPNAIKMPAQIAGGRPVTFTITNMPQQSDTIKRKQWDDRVARFQKMYPNVTVKGDEYTYDPQTFPAKVAAKQLPTMFSVYLTDPLKYISSGVATDITDIFDASKLRDIYNTDIINLVISNNKVYGLPWNAYAMGLGYNIKLLKDAGFSKPPATWDELRSMAKKLTKRDAGVVGFSMINDAGPATGWHFTIVGYTFGAKPGELISLGKDGKYTAGFGQGPMVDTLTLIKNLRWTDDVLPRETVDWPTNGTKLATGQAAMVLMAGDQYAWIKTTYRDTDMSNLGFAPMPAGPAGSVSLIGGDTYMVSSDATADQKEAAVYWELWRLFDPKEVQTDLEAQKAEENAAVGGPALPMYKGDYQTNRFAFAKTYYTLPYDNYSAFLDAIAAGKVRLQVEPTSRAGILPGSSSRPEHDHDGQNADPAASKARRILSRKLRLIGLGCRHACEVTRHSRTLSVV